MNYKRYRIEINVLLVFILLFGAVCYWQTSSKLTRQDVDTYIAALEQNLPQQWPNADEFISRLRTWGYEDDGNAVYMLNLMRYYPSLKPEFGVDQSLTPEQANNAYEQAVKPMLVKGGGTPYFAGTVNGISADTATKTQRSDNAQSQQHSNLIVFEPALDDWNRVLVIRYPGRRAFFELISAPEYLAKAPLKLASLEVLLTPMAAELLVPDLRLVTGVVLAFVFLLLCLYRQKQR